MEQFLDHFFAEWNGDDLIVERATDDDLADVIAVDAAHMRHARADHLAEAVKRHECYIVREGWDVLGFAILTQSFFEQYFIDLIVVHPDQRRKGVASALMQHIEKIVPAEKLFTSTNQSNAPMQALCEKLGFVKSGWIDNLDDGDPEIIYFKRLQYDLSINPQFSNERERCYTSNYP